MRFKSILAATGVLAILAAFLASPAFAQQANPPSGTKPVCANCHEQQHTSIMLTAHGAKNDANGSMCQTCHGDASAHLKDPMASKPPSPFKKGLPAAQKDAVCLTCHAGNRHLVFWESGKHAKNEVSCSNCHNMHGKPGNVAVAPFTTSFRPNESELCGTCHQPIRAATLKPSHHPIIEGKIKCSDCHNPHGALTPVMLRAETVNQQCYSCHADKRGPYVFSHPAVDQSCLSCHNPHGSVYAKLLNEKLPNLCQDCHDVARHPGTVYGGAAGFTCPPGATTDPTNAACFNKAPGAFNTAVNTRFIARACTNCHNAIHGSNAPGNRGQFLLR
ncbi:MAG: DmsE family decaheme c-type cytochrome [Aromatoleum sp.]|nr:DmsE family decaheme c-type cytochrome [Aromatoleum sp.]